MAKIGANHEQRAIDLSANISALIGAPSARWALVWLQEVRNGWIREGDG
jgi:hypothetical protein